MKIAFIGQKGIPAKWGGIETHVHELSQRLVKRNHSVSVYVRDWYTDKAIEDFNGVKIIHTPSYSLKWSDAVSHSISSSIHALFNHFDIIHYHGIGPSFLCWIPKLGKGKVLVTIHRFDYESEKWNLFGKKFLKLSEKVALRTADKTIVVASYQKDFYKKNGYDTIYIPNGVNISEMKQPSIIKTNYNLSGNDYFLYLGRLTPEKRSDWVIKAFIDLKKEVKKDLKLVIAGDSSSTDGYTDNLKKISVDKDIIFTGNVTGSLKEELFSNAFLFILPSILEGLPLALLEAFSYRRPCLASDIPPHKELIKDNYNGFLFKTDDYRDFLNKIIKITGLDADFLERIGSNSLEIIKNEYNWDNIVDRIEQLYKEVLNGKNINK